MIYISEPRAAVLINYRFHAAELTIISTSSQRFSFFMPKPAGTLSPAHLCIHLLCRVARKFPRTLCFRGKDYECANGKCSESKEEHLSCRIHVCERGDNGCILRLGIYRERPVNCTILEHNYGCMPMKL